MLSGPNAYEKAWSHVLEKHVVTHAVVKRIAAELRKNGTLLFPVWEAGKRVPQDTYRVSRAPG